MIDAPKRCVTAQRSGTKRIFEIFDIQQQSETNERTNQTNEADWAVCLQVSVRVVCSDEGLAIALVVLSAGLSRWAAADLHLDLGQSVLHLPLLLAQFDAHGRVLRLEHHQPLAQPLDLLFEQRVRHPRAGAAACQARLRVVVHRHARQARLDVSVFCWKNQNKNTRF